MASTKRPNLQARVVWAEVFGIPDPSSEEALLAVQSHLLSLRKLFADTESALRQTGDINEDLYIGPLHRLLNVINLNGLHNGWENFNTYLGTQDLFSLKFSADLLNKNADTQENEISNDEIKTLIADLNELYEQIVTSAIPDDLKTTLLDLVSDMLRGVHEYRVRGAVALKDALSKSIGVVAANKQAIDENVDSDEIQALARMLIRVDKLYSFATRVQPLLQAAAHLVPLLAAHVK